MFLFFSRNTSYMKGKILFALMLLIVPMAIAVVDNEPSADGDWSHGDNKACQRRKVGQLSSGSTSRAKVKSYL